MNDACLIESRREERVLQLLRLFNPSLEKRKETCKYYYFYLICFQESFKKKILTYYSHYNLADRQFFFEFIF